LSPYSTIPEQLAKEAAALAGEGGDSVASDAAVAALKQSTEAASGDVAKPITRTRIKATPRTFDRLREEGGSGHR
jgi:hypothetical protein